MTSQQVTVLAWYRDMAYACAFAIFFCLLTVGLVGFGNGATPAQVASTTVEAPLACRASGIVGQDGNTASAVANHLAGRRGAEALRIMQGEGNDALDLVHPGQILSVPVPC